MTFGEKAKRLLVRLRAWLSDAETRRQAARCTIQQQEELRRVLAAWERNGASPEEAVWLVMGSETA